MLITSATWWVTRRTEHETRRLKRARVKAQKEGLTVLEDVEDVDLRKYRSTADEHAARL
jgi:hypothetical protein